MASYTGTVPASLSQEEAWRYLADLRSVRDWDPSVKAARLIEGEPGEVGSRYELEVGFLGRTVTLPYETVASDPPHRLVFQAETDAVSVVDEARILPLPAGSHVTWDASLGLKGARRMLELPLQAAFSRLGRRAEDGLRRQLGERAMAGAHA
jgi:carbon monoxide dehydrogenase subunit G